MIEVTVSSGGGGGGCGAEKVLVLNLVEPCKVRNRSENEKILGGLLSCRRRLRVIHVHVGFSRTTAINIWARTPVLSLPDFIVTLENRERREK